MPVSAASSHAPRSTKSRITNSRLFDTIVSGGISGVVSEVAVFPIDVLALRMKVSLRRNTSMLRMYRSIVQNEGRRALFSGVGIVLLAAVPSKSLFFIGYEGVKGLGEKCGVEKLKPFFNFAAGMCSEVLSSMVYVPEEVIKSRMMLGRITDRHWMVDNSHYKTSLHAAREIFHTEGIRGFYSGYCSCILTDCVNSGFQVLFYEAIRSRVIKYHKEKREGDLRLGEEIGLAAASAVLSTIISNPFDLITCRLMVQDRSGAKYYHGIGDVIKKVYRNEGIFGFYKGLLPRMMYVTPLVAIQYSGYQLIRKSIGLTQSM